MGLIPSHRRNEMRAHIKKLKIPIKVSQGRKTNLQTEMYKARMQSPHG